jgi:biopolymer transport protein ExbB
MRKNFLLRTFLLAVALAAVLAVIVTTTLINFGGSSVETSQSQTFFKQFVAAGGPIVWFILLPMSVVTVFLAVEHGFIIRRKKLLPDGVGRRVVEIIRQFGPEQLEAQIGSQNDFISVAVVKAVGQSRGDWLRMRSALAESLQEQAWGLMRRIEWFNLIGNVSPMVGLFGTVFGMIKLFNAIVLAGGQPQPVQLADGISVALVTTFWGLIIAIPALAVHGVFRNRIETLVSDAIVEVENIEPEIRLSLSPVGRSAGKSAGPASAKTSDGVKRQSRAEAQDVGKTKLPIKELPTKPTKTIGESLPLR